MAKKGIFSDALRNFGNDISARPHCSYESKGSLINLSGLCACALGSYDKSTWNVFKQLLYEDTVETYVTCEAFDWNKEW